MGAERGDGGTDTRVLVYRHTNVCSGMSVLDRPVAAPGPGDPGGCEQERPL